MNSSSSSSSSSSSFKVPLSRARSVSSYDGTRPNINPNIDPKSLDLEASLHHFLNLHSHNSLILRHHTEKAKKEAIRKAERVSELLVESVNGGVQESFLNEKRIENEIRSLASTIARFMKQTDQWLAATHALNTAVKEIGDFENWMKVMEYDCKSITSAIQNIHQE